MNWSDKIAKKLGARYPIVQAPMLGVTTPEMVAAATRADCIGSLALGDLDAEQCIGAIRATRKLTGKQFVVNIFANDIPAITPELRKHYAAARETVEDLARSAGLEVSIPDIDAIRLPGYHERVEAVISENCTALSFTFGNLDNTAIERLKGRGIVLIGTCTSVDEAVVLEKSGIDIICVQGIEAGGHRGSFLPGEVPLIGGFSLLPQVYERVRVPLIYAGGICNARTLLAARTLGAEAFQVGSMLLRSEESSLRSFEKQRLEEINAKDIVLTRSFTGRFARGLKNRFMEALDQSGRILPYPYQNKLTAGLRKMAKQLELPDFVSIWVGQSPGKISNRSTTHILEQLVADTVSLSASVPVAARG